MEMLRYAILGPGKISHRFLNGMQYADDAKVTVFACRDPQKAQDYAREAHVETVETYEQMYDDPAVDAVYIATPPFVHYRQILDCLNHGKHVLCEKPLCETADQARELFALARSKHLTLMEAQKGLFLPAWQDIRSWLDEQRIGRVLAAEASFCRRNTLDRSHWVFTMPCSGAMYDVGVYPLAELLSLFPAETVSLKRTDAYAGECPISSVITMVNADGVLLDVKASIDYTAENYLNIYGESGRIECQDFWKTRTALCIPDSGERILKNYDYPSEFTFEISHFSELVRQGVSESPRMSSALSIREIGIVEKRG
jgi:predicted dehydrogenase